MIVLLLVIGLFPVIVSAMSTPALIFGGLHFSPGTYGTVNALVYVLNAAVAGTLAAFITLRTGNLGASAGLHFGNNRFLDLSIRIQSPGV